MSIPLVDLKAQFSALRDEIMPAIEQALQSMQLFLGPNVQALEQDFSEYCGARFGIGVSSGTQALHLALRAAGVGAGDEVITVPWTFIATVEAIVYTGATPVLVDIEPQTYCIDVEALERAITPRTKAIVPVHVYGHPSDMDRIMALAADHGLFVLEDAAQAHGARYRERTVGSLGHAAAFSFYMSKNLGAYGEAGMITTNDEALAERVRMLRNHGDVGRHEHRVIGYNARLDEVQAAVLRVKLRYLPEWIKLRQEHAAAYHERLADLPVTTPFVADWAEHSFYLYTIRTPHREQVVEQLKARDIGCALHYQRPQHHQPACAPYVPDTNAFPNCDAASPEVLCLPMYPELTEEQIAEVCEVVGRPRG
jgi:dTDP-4-amino-4,6-dideoxygalactose transaminase